nr:nucleoside deaminase [uncultured Bifidobacterium sp.]
MAELHDAMGHALALADQAGRDGETPVGAVVLDASGQVVGSGRNRRRRDRDPLAHAEIEALRSAVGATGFSARTRRTLPEGSGGGGWNLSGCTMVVTLEPCPMCAGALLQTHIARVVFGAWDAKLGACGSVWDLLRDPHDGSRPEVYGGVMERECVGVLSGFFRERRDGRPGRVDDGCGSRPASPVSE